MESCIVGRIWHRRRDQREWGLRKAGLRTLIRVSLSSGWGPGKGGSDRRVTSEVPFKSFKRGIRKGGIRPTSHLKSHLLVTRERPFWGGSPFRIPRWGTVMVSQRCTLHTCVLYFVDSSEQGASTYVLFVRNDPLVCTCMCTSAAAIRSMGALSSARI